MGIMLTGTLHDNSRGIPVIPKKLKIGECLNYGHKDKMVITSREEKFKKKTDWMLSTYVAAGMAEVHTAGGHLKKKPCCIILYNNYMRGGLRSK